MTASAAMSAIAIVLVARGKRVYRSALVTKPSWFRSMRWNMESGPVNSRRATF